MMFQGYLYDVMKVPNIDFCCFLILVVSLFDRSDNSINADGYVRYFEKSIILFGGSIEW